MLFRLLGPLEVTGSSSPVNLNARRQQVVLATLLLEANRLVPVDRLVDAVWSAAPPLTARGQIQTCVSAIRRTLEASGLTGRITTRRPGYLLKVSDDEMDLHRFDRLVSEGRRAAASDRHADAVQRFRTALSLWRGDDPLSGLDSDALRSAVTGLSERRLTVLEECHAAELALGRHRELVDGLIQLVDRYPLRERLRHQLMLALYRCGRKAEALVAYRAARKTLVTELGIEPAEDLRRLERLILGGDPSLDLPDPPIGPPPAVLEERGPDLPTVPRTLPADNSLLTGRDEAVAKIVAHLGADRTGNLATTVVTGRAGVGKTALAVHTAHRLASTFTEGQLYARLEDDQGGPVAVEEVLSRLLRAVGIPEEGIPADLDGLAARYRSAVAGRRILVVLDGATHDSQVLPLLPGSPSCGVLITSRQRLTGVPGAQLVGLDDLSIQHATDLLITLIGINRVSAEPAASFDLLELCGGLPLALRIAGERLAARPHWAIAELTDRLSDDQRLLNELVHGGLDIRTGISTAYQRLRPSAQRLFRLLSLIRAPDFPAWVAGPLLGGEGDAGRDDLEQLVDAQLVDVEHADRGGARYRMHKLARSYARELFDAQASGENAEALERLLGAWLFLAEEAHRREYGGAYPVIHGPARRWPLPPTLVEHLLRRPLDWFEQERANLVEGIGQAATHGFAEFSWDLAITMVGLFKARSHLEDWRSTHTTALLACRQAHDHRGEAAILYSLGILNMFEQRYDEAAGRLALAQRAFEEVGEDRGRALCLRSAAFLNRVGTGWVASVNARAMR